ncbi:MAG: hypothetical protein KAX38_05405, partial [Candidatus Krumholzibacteria bacterium]|nr:hypothetical protein [Candidatus Krumholzibacteria bacterium]
MKSFGRGGVATFILLASVLSPRAAGAADSTVVSAPVDRFRPTWESFTRSRDTYLSMGSDMNIAIEPGGGWLIKNSMNIEHKSYRGRDMQEIAERLMNYVSKSNDLYSFNFNIGETYMKKKTIGLARFGKDLIVDNESATFRMQYMKPLLKSKKSTVNIKGDARRGRNDFKYDRSMSGSASGTLFYEFSELLNFSGGAGTSMRRESSEIGSRKVRGMPSSADTFRINMAYGRGKDKLLGVKYSRAEGVERNVAPPRGNSMEILDNPELAQEEEARRKLESLEMNSFIQPLSYLSVVFSFKHELNSQKNRVDKRLSKEMERTDLGASTVYQYCEKGKVAIDFSRSEGVVDYGPFSLSSYDERRKLASVRVSHRIKDSLSVYVKGSASLKQRFYRKRDANPRDADYLLYQANAS